MINIEGVKKIVGTFAMLAEQYPGEETVRMDSTTIQRTAECGTYACHAGWFAYAQMENSSHGTWVGRSTSEIYMRPDGTWADYGNDREIYARHDGTPVSFDDGANRMATTAGFVDTGIMTPAEVLEQWAADNPAIWGNKYGKAMFCSGIAFNPGQSRFDMPLRTVADHWKGVYERLCAAAAAT